MKKTDFLAHVQAAGELGSAKEAERWTPRGLLMDREALLQHVGAALGTHVPAAERALPCVWSVLRKAISGGAIADFQAHVPEDVAEYLARVA